MRIAPCNFRMSRIVITTCGSLGDLFPYVAVALELKRRGHEVILATSPCYRQRIEKMGLGFHGVRPDVEWLSDPVRVRRMSHPRFGLLRVGREFIMPALRQSYEDTLAAAAGADLLIGMMATYGTRLVAEKCNIPWISAVHIPMGFFSAYDPPLMDMSPGVSQSLRFLGRHFWGPLFWFGKRASRFMAKEWYRLRSEIGLPKTREGNPLVDSHSARLVLALFSKLLAAKQPDWPRQTVVTGFPFHDADGQGGFSSPLEQFLDNGPPPIVFTLGSAVSANAGSFYEHSLACAKLLNRRAVLVTGKVEKDRQGELPADVIAVEYAPFTLLFPRAAAIVHHGGVGTTGMAMRSGRPTLIVPNAWDQPDNAARVSRLGISRTISKNRYTPDRAAAELRRLFDTPAYAERARDVGQQIRGENGVQAASDAVEGVLQRLPAR